MTFVTIGYLHITLTQWMILGVMLMLDASIPPGCNELHITEFYGMEVSIDHKETHTIGNNVSDKMY